MVNFTIGLVKIPVTNSEIVNSADGGKFFMLCDPDGNTFI